MSKTLLMNEVIILHDDTVLPMAGEPDLSLPSSRASGNTDIS